MKKLVSAIVLGCIFSLALIGGIPNRGWTGTFEGNKAWFSLKQETSTYFMEDSGISSEVLFLRLEEPIPDNDINRAALASTAISYLGLTERDGFGTHPEEWRGKASFQEKGFSIHNSKTPQVVMMIMLTSGEKLAGVNAAIGYSKR